MALSKKSSFKDFTTKQICVTGASGYIGFRLVGELLKQGFLIKALTRNKKQLFPKGVDIYLGDLASPDLDLREFLSGCDVLIHCAGEIKSQSKMKILHIDGLQRLSDGISAEIRLTGKNIHWVQLSSVGVYGSFTNSSSTPKVVNESTEISPVGIYEQTKAEADKLLLKVSISAGFTFTILRPSNVVSFLMPNESFEALLLAIKKRRFFYIGSRNSIATYIHLDDVVEALVLCATEVKAKNQIFNLSNDCKFSDIVSAISLYVGIKLPFKCFPEKLLRCLVMFTPRFLKLPLTKTRIDALVSQTRYPASKIKMLLGFTPSRSIPDFAVDYLKNLDG